MNVLKAKYDLGGVESCNVRRNFIQLIKDLHKISRFNVLNVDVDDPFVLSYSLHFKYKRVIHLRHKFNLVVEMGLLCPFDQTIFGLKLDGKAFIWVLIILACR